MASSTREESMVLVIGELINTSRKTIKEAIESQDADYIKDIALKQVEAGAHCVDINCGTFSEIDREPETMVWLVQTVREVTTVPLSVDTPDPEALEAGLRMLRDISPIINSITAENHRYETILPLALKYKARVIALCMDDRGIPESAADRIRIVRWLVDHLVAAGIPKEDIYLDPLVRPVSTGDQAGLSVLETIRFIRSEYPEVHSICGLSNISYGLPNRRVLNQTFLVQTMTMGMDAYILDPLDKGMMGFLYASQALLGQDQYCRQYLGAHRKGFYRQVL